MRTSIPEVYVEYQISDILNWFTYVHGDLHATPCQMLLYSGTDKYLLQSREYVLENVVCILRLWTQRVFGSTKMFSLEGNMRKNVRLALYY
jgi:hypothetical protein